MKHNFVMPSASDYQAAIQNPGLCFKDKELAASSPIRSASGLPSSASGRFAIVFPLENHSKNIAVRCFTIFFKDQEKRYTLIDKALKQAKLPFFVDFAYKDEGIYLDNRWFPVLKMDWIEGKLLDQYILDNRKAPEKLDSVKNELISIFRALKKNSIAHCDLQPGNIIVTDKGIKLVDYDGLFVPGMEGMKRNELGQPNYQHPALTEENFDEEMDEFSIWTILLSINALQFNPGLLTEKTFEREYILFQQSDFKEPNSSQMFNELKKIPDKKFQKLLKEFSVMCKEQILEEYAIDHDWSVKSRVEKKPRTNTVSTPDRKVDRSKSSIKVETLSEKYVPPMIFVEKGSFTMGDTWGDGSPAEKPTHKVTFTYNFHIGKYETTFDEYDAFCEATGRSKPRDSGWGRGQRPVINVSWNDAVAYCNWLSKKEKLPRAYNGKGKLLDKDGRVTTDITKVLGYRLPTEAEWEYAARGGNKSKGYKYAGSDDVDKVAWYASNSGNKTQEVGKKAPNEMGIYDMSGNVWECCSDWWGSYSSSAQTNPYNSTAGYNRVRRGGSWSNYAAGTRVAYLRVNSPTGTGSNLGFRICRTVPYEGKNRPPLTPYTPSPSDKATNQPLTVTLSWNCSNPDGDTLTYDVYFGTITNPPKVSTNQSGKSLNRTNLSYGTTYYWRVVAKDNKGGVTEGPVWSFTTASRPPNPPSSPSPSNNAVKQPTALSLSWDCSDPDGNPLTYDIYFDTNTNPTTKVSSSQTVNSLSIKDLSYNTTYYWKVVAKDSKGATTEGSVWKFSTHDIDASTYKPARTFPATVLVEKGSFTMGDTWGYGGSVPRAVGITYNFYIGKYETTFGEYDAFCEATGRGKPNDQNWGGGQRPIINVSWWDAIAYCNWLSEKENLPKAYNKDGNFLDKDGRITADPSKVVGYRLPTEAEWEYAARGGNKSKGYKYAGSDDVDKVAWYASNSGNKTLEVGKKAPNELGLYDMSGNVWEWCSDWYGSYSGLAQTNPYNSASDSYRMFRGGSWGSDAANTRVAYRGYGAPASTYNFLGFRICKMAPFEGENRPLYESYNSTVFLKATERVEISPGIYNSQDRPDEIVDSNREDEVFEIKSKDPENSPSVPNKEKGRGFDTPRNTDKKKCLVLLSFCILFIVLIIFFIFVRMIPSGPSPSNNAINQPVEIRLSWECRAPDGNPLTYDIYFDTNTDPTTKISSEQIGKSLSITDLSYNTTYYWRVVAKDSKGATTEGPVWRFTTQAGLTTSSYTPSSIVPQMTLVEKGSFTMGDTWGDGYDNEKLTHKVTFTYNFHIGKYETTFDEYDAFCEATGRGKPEDEGWGRGTRPVMNVSWNDSIAYCNWLSEKENLPKAYDDKGNFLDKDGMITTDPSKVVGYRLPTEAEWEYAARGGNKSKGYKYSGSDNVDDVAWYTSNSGNKTQEVGKKAPNELGIYDMSGNVWEWCSDWYGGYSSSAQTNPYKNSGSGRVLRGGSWDLSATHVRVALRLDYSPTYTFTGLGFRICRTVP